MNIIGRENVCKTFVRKRLRGYFGILSEIERTSIHAYSVNIRRKSVWWKEECQEEKCSTVKWQMHQYGWQCNPLWDIVETIQIDRYSWSWFLLFVVDVYSIYWTDEIVKPSCAEALKCSIVKNRSIFVVDKPIVTWVIVECESEMLIYAKQILRILGEYHVTLILRNLSFGVAPLYIIIFK